MAEPETHLLEFRDLDGWENDDHAAALSVFLNTCQDFDNPEWQAICAVANDHPLDQARSFFELFFRPVMTGGEAPALFTGYFEPELRGSLRQHGPYQYPIYRLPPEVSGVWRTRQEIEESGVLNGRGLEIAWIDDPVEVFFLQIQGSGRVRLDNGQIIRVGYGGKNGREYSSIGQELVRRGVYEPHQVSAQVIRNWVRRNPQLGRELLHHNESFVFFREVEIDDPSLGPLGAMNRSITTGRTIAVDPEFTPLGAPVWIEKGGLAPMRRLMVAQDTGSAIRGPQRADVFNGTGDEAGEVAGRVRDPGRMITLLPIELAFRIATDV